MPLCCHNADVLPPDLTIHKSGHNATIFHQKWGYDVSKCNMDRKGVVASASGVLEGSGEIPPPPQPFPVLWSGSFSHESGQFNSYVGPGMFLSAPAKTKSS